MSHYSNVHVHAVNAVLCQSYPSRFFIAVHRDHTVCVFKLILLSVYIYSRTLNTTVENRYVYISSPRRGGGGGVKQGSLNTILKKTLQRKPFPIFRENCVNR